MLQCHANFQYQMPIVVKSACVTTGLRHDAERRSTAGEGQGLPTQGLLVPYKAGTTCTQ